MSMAYTYQVNPQCGWRGVTASNFIDIPVFTYQNPSFYTKYFSKYARIVSFKECSLSIISVKDTEKFSELKLPMRWKRCIIYLWTAPDCRSRDKELILQDFFLLEVGF